MTGQLTISGALSVALFTLADVNRHSTIGSLRGSISWSDSTASEITMDILGTGTGSPTEAEVRLSVTKGALAGARAFSVITVGGAEVPITNQSVDATGFTLARGR
jgi:hypothetical protein